MSVEDLPLIPEGALEESVHTEVRDGELLIGVAPPMARWSSPTWWDRLRQFWWWLNFRRTKDPRHWLRKVSDRFDTKIVINHRVYEVDYPLPVRPFHVFDSHLPEFPDGKAT